MENIDLKKLSAEQLCDLFNDETAQVKHWDIIQEFIDRKNIHSQYSTSFG